MSASSTLSTSSCRTMRQRVAPSETRTGDFARAMRRPRQQQVGDVGAGDQQHEPDRAHQRQEHRPDRAAVEALVERLDVRLDVLVGVRIVAASGAGRWRPARPAPAPASRRARAGRTPRSRARCASAARARGTIASGCHRSAFCGNLKPSGITPMTTDGTSLTRTVRPIRRDRCRSGSSRRRCRA